MIIENESMTYMLNYIEQASNFSDDIQVFDVKSDVICRVPSVLHDISYNLSLE